MSYCGCNPYSKGNVTQDSTKIESYVKVVAGGFTDEMKEKLDGIEEGANNYTLPAATEGELGGVKVGKGLAIDADGTLYVDPSEIDYDGSSDGSSDDYVLPPASESQMGGVIVGEGLIVDENGVVSVDPDYACGCIQEDQILDGGDADGEEEEIQYLDGGSAAG